MHRFVSMLSCGALFAGLGSAASAYTIVDRNDHNRDTNRAYGEIFGYCGPWSSASSTNRAFTINYQSDDQGTGFYNVQQPDIEYQSEDEAIMAFCQTRGG